VLGISINDVQDTEIMLLTMMPDDSGSIEARGNTQMVLDGHNLVLDALKSSAQKDSILVHTRFLNGHILFPYTPLANAVRLDPRNYDPRLGTPLFDQFIVLLGTVLAKAQEFAEQGVYVRTATLLITDGADQHSKKADASMVQKVVSDMLAMEDHLIFAMGIDDGETDFAQVFREMGIKDDCILTPLDAVGEVRQAFQVFSQSAVRHSQTMGGSRPASLGGFR
jgi:hypothetical protein